MSIVELALKRPYLFIVMAMLIVLAPPFALLNRDRHLSRTAEFMQVVPGEPCGDGLSRPQSSIATAAQATGDA